MNECYHSWWDSDEARTTVGDTIICNKCGAKVNIFQIPPAPEKVVKEKDEPVEDTLLFDSTRWMPKKEEDKT